jgi:hypothetical protein
MSIERKPSGFYEWDADPRLGQPHAVGVESKRLEKCLAHYNAIGARGLFGHPDFGFKEDNLDFLRRAKVKPRWLWFWDVALENIDALYLIDELDYFGVNPKRPGIDFSRFRRLDVVINHWIKADTGLPKAAIGEYHLWHFKPRSKSFEEAAIPLGVKRLELYWANPASLDGLPVLTRLTELRIHRCRNLADLSALPRVAPNLRHLLATTSSRLVPKTGVLDHPKLETALISGKEHLKRDS